MKRGTLYTIATIAGLIPFAYLLYLYPQLPESVPTHFGVDGKPDDYSSRSSLFFITALMTLVGAGIFLLLLNLHKIDPKKRKNSPQVMAKVALAIFLFTTLINLMVIVSARTSSLSFDKFLLPAMGLFFAFLGNMFYSVKPNYFVGIRTPWALENEDNWRRTHHLAAKVWFAGGIVAMILTIVLPFQIAIFVFFGITFTMVIIPLVYSFRIYQQTKKLN